MGDEASRRMLLQKLKSRGVDSGESGEGFSGGAEIEEYIMNPKSGRLVLKTGKLGRKILVEQGGERKKRGRPRKPESEKKPKKPKGKRGRPKKSSDKVEELMTQKMITLIDDDKTPEKKKKKKKKKVQFEPSGKNKINKKLLKEVMTPEFIEYLDTYSEVDIPREDNMNVSHDDLDSLLAKMGSEGTTKPADGDTGAKKGVRVPKKGRYVITEKKGDTITFQLKQ